VRSKINALRHEMRPKVVHPANSVTVMTTANARKSSRSNIISAVAYDHQPG
jgi:hypothetical protein